MGNLLLGIVIGAIAATIITYFVIRNNKSLLRNWINKS